MSPSSQTSQAVCSKQDVTCSRNGGGVADIDSICGCVPCRELRCQSSSNAVDVCFAMDQSGSICNPNPRRPNTCSNCDRGFSSSCWDRVTARSLCCRNYEQVVDFTTQIVQQVNSISPNSRFGYAKFSTRATRVSGLTSASNIENQLLNERYAGGWTNTADAIDECSVQESQSGE